MILLPQKVAYRGTLTGLRISAVDGTAFIDNCSGATLDLGSSVVNAAGTAAIRISSVDGTAFVDTSDATLAAALAANAGKYLIITDASGRYLKGWIKAAGTGETLGNEIITGWSNHSGLAYDTLTVNANGHDIDSLVNATEQASCCNTTDHTPGILSKIVVNLTLTSGNTSVLRIGNTVGGADRIADPLVAGNSTYYSTWGSTYKRLVLANTDFDNRNTNETVIISDKQVLTPSSSGATIVSTKGGTTYNFESKDASFTYNAASYTYAIYDRDVTALADGNHLIEIYDASGRMLRGYLGAAGDGETLDGELITDGGFDVDGAWKKTGTWTVGGSKASVATAVSNSQIYQACLGAGAAGKLYYTSFVLLDYVSGGVGITLGSSTFGSKGTRRTSNNTYTEYICASEIIDTYAGLYTHPGGGYTGSVDSLSIKQVLTPSALGATIVSAKGGATENFAYKDASFTYNEASYQVIVRAARGDGEDESVYIPQFTTDDVAGVTFGGFYVSKFINSQPSARNEAGDAWYDVAHGGAAGSVVPKSKRGVPVWDYINFPQAMIACANKGKGWHLISAFEWASLAFLSKKLGTMPHGGNNNVNPPADYTYSTETAQLDKHLKAESGYNRALPGTGPAAWADNHLASGVYDLNGLVSEWVLMMMSTDGYPYVPANLDTTYTGSPYGRGTISGSGGASPTLTVDGAGVNWLKDWTVDEFNGCYCYIAEAASGAGALYAITDTTATTVVLTNGDAPGNGTATFAIFKLVATDITNGMTSGQKILTLRDSDNDLNAFALPATADGTGAAAYGNDGYYFDKAAARAALRGGHFSSATSAGVFCLVLSGAPSSAGASIGFRAAKAKGAP